MKWFKHYSDSYTNFKIQALLRDCGVVGYGLYWLCLELVAQQGRNYRIKKEKNWKKTLEFWTRIEEKKISEILDVIAGLRLIEGKALKMGVLFIPKMAEYSDDYTNKVRRVSVHGTDKVLLDKIRIDKNRLDKNISMGRFTPPTPQEVNDYCTERKNGIDGQRFIDFYSAKGWMIGKNKMKDWRAAVRTWERGMESKTTERKTKVTII